MNIRCIIIEDEPAAQSILEQYITRCPGCECAGVFSDAFAAQDYLNENKCDLMFLDINLPEMSGVSFLRSLTHPPPVIFTTAYSQYAIEGFELEVVDFLLKPFSYERFSRAVNKAREKLAFKATLPASNTISVKADRRIYQINTADILFIESCGDYVTLHFKERKLVVHGTLKSWEDRMIDASFLKVHRTTLVNYQKIDHIEGNLISVGSHKLPLSEVFKAQLLEKMFGD